MSTIEDQPDPPAQEAYEETGSIEPPQTSSGHPTLVWSAPARVRPTHAKGSLYGTLRSMPLVAQWR